MNLEKIFIKKKLILKIPLEDKWRKKEIKAYWKEKKSQNFRKSLKFLRKIIWNLNKREKLIFKQLKKNMKTFKETIE